MSTRTCPTCETRPLPETHTVCRDCVHTLRNQLHDLRTLMRALDDALAGQLKFGQKVGGKSANTPLPVNLRAAEAAYIARTTILTWTDHIAHARGEATPDTWPTIERFLDIRAGWLATQTDGPTAIDEIQHALHTARRAVDRPADRHYAGPCTNTTLDTDGLTTDCDGELYAATNRTTVTCPRCHTEYEVATRREWLLNEAWDAIATGPDITRALAGEAFGGLSVNLSTIRTWAANGRLERIDVINGRPRYRIGDVIQLATGTHTTRRGEALANPA